MEDVCASALASPLPTESASALAAAAKSPVPEAPTRPRPFCSSRRVVQSQSESTSTTSSASAARAAGRSSTRHVGCVSARKRRRSMASAAFETTSRRPWSWSVYTELIKSESSLLTSASNSRRSDARGGAMRGRGTATRGDSGTSAREASHKAAMVCWFEDDEARERCEQSKSGGARGVKSRRPRRCCSTAIAVHAARSGSAVFDDLVAGWSADVAPLPVLLPARAFWQGVASKYAPT